MRQDRMTWHDIAKAVGMTVRACHRIHAAALAAPAISPEDPMELIGGHLDVLRVVMEEAAEASVAAPPGSTAQIGALRLLTEASSQAIGVRQAVGLMPRSLAQVRRDHDLALLFASVIEVLEQHDVPEAVLDDLHRMAEGIARPELPISTQVDPEL